MISLRVSKVMVRCSVGVRLGLSTQPSVRAHATDTEDISEGADASHEIPLRVRDRLRTIAKG